MPLIFSTGGSNCGCGGGSGADSRRDRQQAPDDERGRARGRALNVGGPALLFGEGLTLFLLARELDGDGELPLRLGPVIRHRKLTDDALHLGDGFGCVCRSAALDRRAVSWIFPGRLGRTERGSMSGVIQLLRLLERRVHQFDEPVGLDFGIVAHHHPSFTTCNGVGGAGISGTGAARANRPSRYG